MQSILKSAGLAYAAAMRVDIKLGKIRPKKSRTLRLVGVIFMKIGKIRPNIKNFATCRTALSKLTRGQKEYIT